MGRKPLGRIGGRLSKGVSIQPKMKLWNPYGNPSVILKNS